MLIPVLPLAAINILGQNLDATDIGVILLLVVLEGVLSIDNALVLGLLAKRLPKHQRARALWYGLVGAFVFRVIAICTASLLLQWTIVLPAAADVADAGRSLQAAGHDVAESENGVVAADPWGTRVELTQPSA